MTWRKAVNEAWQASFPVVAVILFAVICIAGMVASGRRECLEQGSTVYLMPLVDSQGGVMFMPQVVYQCMRYADRK